MDIKLSISSSSIKRLFSQMLHRFHIIIFVVVVFGGLAIVILMLNNIIVKSGDTSGYSPTSNSSTFDQTTIKRIEELKTTTQNSGDLDLSHGRTNPFVE